MKKQFFDILFELMKTNKDIYILFAGLGYPRLDEFIKAYPDRAYNFEASEQTCLDACVGLAYEGKTPFIYTITPFLYRGFETIRTYINHEELNVKLIGAGRDDDYSKDDGFSHFAGDDFEILGLMANIEMYWPSNEKELKKDINEMLKKNGPCYLNLTR